MENNRRERKRRPSRANVQSEQTQIEYTKPKPFAKKRLIVQLLTVTAIVLAVAVGTSIFFKVDTILVAGAEKYTAYEVEQASGIEIGDHLLFFGQAEAAARIKAQLPYVGTVRFERKLPGTVTIVIEEKTAAYKVKAADGTYWKMTSDGMIVEKAEATDRNTPTIEGLILADPAVGETAVADETQQEGTATGAERLNAATEILHLLELWKPFAAVSQVELTCIDVTDLYALHLLCGEQYRVELGSAEAMGEKMQALKSVFNSADIPQSGVWTLLSEDGTWRILYNSWT